MLDQPKWDPHTPRQIEDLVGNQETWSVLAESIRKNQCPHIVLCGPAGCGKSLFARLVLEQEKQCPVLHIECTANSGLRDLRDLIRGFARGSRTGKGDYRWIILEHADALAGDTQAFLRRMMETTSNSTRFLFECVDAGAISEPILSRSTLYVVNPPTEQEFKYELQRRTEFSLTDEETEAIFRLAGDTLRNGIYLALTQRWNRQWSTLVSDYKGYKEILAKVPAKTADDAAWVQWGVYAEKECRLRGLDYRDLFQLGWPLDPDVSYMRAQWSRLGGISSKALFFRALHSVYKRGRVSK